MSKKRRRANNIFDQRSNGYDWDTFVKRGYYSRVLQIREGIVTIYYFDKDKKELNLNP